MKSSRRAKNTIVRKSAIFIFESKLAGEERKLPPMYSQMDESLGRSSWRVFAGGAADEVNHGGNEVQKLLHRGLIFYRMIFFYPVLTRR